MNAHVQDYQEAMNFLAEVVVIPEADEVEDGYWNDEAALELAAEEHFYYMGFKH